jgi:sugar O-acyltransferase (sialic acid O-acetyltransferase NeuD family)
LHERVLILGAGGLGREMFSFAERHPECGSKWVLGGFLDDNPNALANSGHPAPIIGSIKDYRPKPGDILLHGLGNPKFRARVVAELSGRGARFMTFIHPTAQVGRNVRLGEGVVLLAWVVLTCDIQIGAHTVFLSFSGAGHDSQTGECCQISGGCDIMGYVKLGSRVLMGSGSRILPKVQVGDDSIVGAGSVVMLRVKPGSSVFGQPAKPLLQPRKEP